MFKLDHLAVVCRDLAQGTDWLEARLGVQMQPGGQHARFGTHNRLLGLADGLYLEVIAPDPAADVTGPRWFGLDDAPEVPRLGNWICQTDDLATHAATAGPAIALERGALRWQITVPDDGSLPEGGAFPTLIKWGAGITHPAQTLRPSGLRLTALHVYRATPLGAAMDPRVTLHAEATRPALEAHFDTPQGPKVLQ